MLSVKNKEILFEELNNIGSKEIQFYLYERIMDNYSSWILCCGINSSYTLENAWKDIVDCFAVYFQANLTLEIERSNMYIIFFIENEISNKLKMTIEYDRYSCRKIILNEKYPKLDSDKEKKIENLIFNIEEYQEDIGIETLSNWLENNEPTVMEIYKKFKNGIISIEEAFSKYSNV
ncbi:hypothetical protein FDF31_03920 [Clostridium sporogenes]|nr:hypothetical protein [Clostridium sporogenes]NFS24817.1 hypothetical protein [Clostridium sporogenes]